MATERLEIVVTSTGVREVARDVRRIGHAADGTRKALAFLRSALVVVASARVIANLAQQLDLYTDLSNRLKLVTNNARELTLVQDALFLVARKTRSDFEGTVTVFQRLAQTTGKLGFTYNQLLDLTENVNKAVILSGASAQSASAGLRQFSQALASGVLQGDELRSVVENLPALATLIGKQFGVTGGELLALNKRTPGIIKLNKIIQALNGNTGDLAKTFAETQHTIGQAFTILNNSITFFFGKLSATTGAGQFLAKAIIQIADNIDKVVIAVTALLAAFTLNFIIAQVLTLNQTLLRLAAAGAGALLNMLKVAVLPLTFAFRALSVAVITNPLFLLGAAAVAGIVGAFVLFQDQIEGVIDSLGGLKGIFNIVVSAAIAAVRTIVNNWEKLPAAFADISIQAGNAIIGGIELGTNKAIEILNSIPGIDISQRILPRIVNNFEGAADAIKNAFVNTYEEIKRADPFGTAKKRIEEVLKVLQTFTAGGLNEQAIRSLLEGLKPKAGTGGLDTIEKLKGAYKSLLQQISPLAKAFFELKTAQDLVKKAQAAGIDTAKQFGLTQEEIIRRVRRNIAGVDEDSKIVEERIKLVNDALKNQAITAEEAARRIRDINIASLESQTTFEAGVERTFLKLQKETEDVASGIEEALNRSFKGAEDALVEFAQTGKLTFSNFLRDLEEQLLRSAIRNLLASLGAQLGFGQQPGGGLIGGLFGSGGGGGPGIGGILSGVGGLLGLPGGQHGLDFQVGASTSLASLNGVDNRLVAFRARDGESVRVTPKGGSDGGGTTVVFNVTTPDADSFRRSQGQIMTDAQVALTRAARRNA